MSFIIGSFIYRLLAIKFISLCVGKGQQSYLSVWVDCLLGLPCGIDLDRCFPHSDVGTVRVVVILVSRALVQLALIFHIFVILCMGVWAPQQGIGLDWCWSVAAEGVRGVHVPGGCLEADLVGGGVDARQSASVLSRYWPLWLLVRVLRLVEAVVITLLTGQPSCHWPVAVVFHRIVILIGALAL